MQSLVLPSGAGKSFIGCALAHAAIRRGHTALYLRTPRLLADLALSRGDGRYVRRHRADDSVTKAVQVILTARLIVVDDIYRAAAGQSGCCRGVLPPG